MESIYTRSMSVKQINKVSLNRKRELLSARIYLNRRGQDALTTHGIIADVSSECKTIEAFKADLEKFAQMDQLSDGVRKNLNNFIKNFLD